MSTIRIIGTGGMAAAISGRTVQVWIHRRRGPYALEYLVRPHSIRLADLALFQMIDEPRFRPQNLVLRRLKFTLEAVTRSPHLWP